MRKLTIDSSVIISSLLENEPRHAEALRIWEAVIAHSGQGRRHYALFPALEWLAAMCSHIPNRGEQMVRYYGQYSNVSRGKRRKEGLDDAIPSPVFDAIRCKISLDKPKASSNTPITKKEVLIN